MLLAENFDADAMLACGMLEQLLPTSEALAGELDAMSEQLAAMGPLALLAMKRHINGIARDRLDVEAIARDIERAQSSEDLREGSRAWQERRPPVFHGR
jgi:enoyl-CoA hydratase/carnithine racemase